MAEKSHLVSVLSTPLQKSSNIASQMFLVEKAVCALNYKLPCENFCQPDTKWSVSVIILHKIILSSWKGSRTELLRTGNACYTIFVDTCDRVFFSKTFWYFAATSSIFFTEYPSIHKLTQERSFVNCKYPSDAGNAPRNPPFSSLTRFSKSIKLKLIEAHTSVM